MDLDPITRHEIEQKLSVVGALLKRDNRPAATDAELWEHCRQLRRSELGEQHDPDLLRAFRVAFNHGYQPALVDLTVTLRRLRTLGFYAETVARDHRRALVAGRWPHDGSADDPWPVEAGPGWITGTSVLAHTDLLTVGRTDTLTSMPVAPGTTLPAASGRPGRRPPHRTASRPRAGRHGVLRDPRRRVRDPG